MPAGLPFIWRVVMNLPHPLVLMWVVWFFCVPAQLAYMFRKNPTAYQLSKTGELMNFREVVAVGCVAGFILLTFITAFCSYITLSLAGLIRGPG
jgi:hypothetical protein